VGTAKQGVGAATGRTKPTLYGPQQSRKGALHGCREQFKPQRLEPRCHAFSSYWRDDIQAARSQVIGERSEGLITGQPSAHIALFIAGIITRRTFGGGEQRNFGGTPR